MSLLLDLWEARSRKYMNIYIHIHTYSCISFSSYLPLSEFTSTPSVPKSSTSGLILASPFVVFVNLFSNSKKSATHYFSFPFLFPCPKSPNLISLAHWLPPWMPHPCCCCLHSPFGLQRKGREERGGCKMAFWLNYSVREERRQEGEEGGKYGDNTFITNFPED